jgi:zinc transport system ATP-binding protein
MASELAIEASSLYFGYQIGEPILEKVSFSVTAGETIACIGPNGGGKTTLLRLLLGFLEPQHGSLSIFGKTPRRAREHMAYVPQAQLHDRLFPVSVEDVVLMGLLRHLPWTGRFSRSQRSQALAALEQVGIQDLAGRSFGSLSGGQAQRALIARALVSAPSILLLDEPTASVDPSAHEQILGILQSLKGSCTIFMVTHDLHTAHRHVDRVLCVQRTVTMYDPEHLCEHFSLGLYHSVQAFGQCQTS